jgi:predicted phage terminase large subunit-like protein
MQRPAPDTGDYFRRDWFKGYSKAPKHLRIYGASDYAVTADGGDFSEHGVFGLDPDGDLYLLDWWSGQASSDVWIETQLDLIDKWKPQAWIGESGPIRRAVEPFMVRRMRERRSLCRLEWLPSIHDKPTRARAFQAMAASGMVYLPLDEDYAQRLLRQLLTFPVGVFDDAVDVCSLIGRYLDQMRDARVPEAAAAKARPGTFAHLLEITDEKREASKYRSLRG